MRIHSLAGQAAILLAGAAVLCTAVPASAQYATTYPNTVANSGYLPNVSGYGGYGTALAPRTAYPGTAALQSTQSAPGAYGALGGGTTLDTSQTGSLPQGTASAAGAGCVENPNARTIAGAAGPVTPAVGALPIPGSSPATSRSPGCGPGAAASGTLPSFAPHGTAQSAVQIVPGSYVRGTARAVSGTTLDISGSRITLTGMAQSPVPGRICRSGNAAWHCGDDATADLARLVSGRTVSCLVTSVTDGMQGLCKVGRDDLSAAIVQDGMATTVDPLYAARQDEARRDGRGIWYGTR